MCETVRNQRRWPFGLSSLSAGICGGLFLVLMVGLRAACELAMMRESGPDAQMPIWELEFVVKIVFWLFGGALAVALLIAFRSRRRASIVSRCVLIAWTVAICNASWEYNRGRRALEVASNLATSPDRLTELVHFDGIQSGYELDNRLASNLNTPIQSLRELSQRDQLGTKMCLMRNPNTPLDLLSQLSGRPIQMVKDRADYSSNPAPDDAPRP